MSPSSSNNGVVSWKMTIYGTALVVVVFLTTYSDVFLIKPYNRHYYTSKDTHQQRHASSASFSSSSSPTLRTANSTNHDDDDNDNNNKTLLSSSSSLLEDILSSRRKAFYQNTTLRSILQENPYCEGKEELLSILYAAATSSPPSTSKTRISRQDKPQDIEQWLQYSCVKLAPWKQVTDLYGTQPIVVGMETCAAYRQHILHKSSLPPRVRVAGLYNSGTTALAHALVDNLPRTAASPAAAGLALTTAAATSTAQRQNASSHTSTTIISPGVPWGKHLPLHYKHTNRHPVDNMEDPDLVLPIVIVRDPYRWMQSMCKTAYDAKWKLRPQHCPNLVPTAHEIKELDASTFAINNNSSNNNKQPTYTYPVNVTYDMARYQHSDVYPSLADWWSSWVQEYIDSPSPRLLIRFEDLLFHAEHVMAKIIECAHGNDNVHVDDLQPYQYKLAQSKTHGRSPNFMEAIFKYARDDTKRSGGMTHQDLAYARGGDHDTMDNNNNNRTTIAAPLRAELLQLFHYHHPPADAPLRIQYRVTNAGRRP